MGRTVAYQKEQNHVTIAGLSVPGYSNLFNSSSLNALDLHMKYIAEVIPLCTYIVWFTSA